MSGLEDDTIGGRTALLDAIAEAAEIGIAADRAQNFCATLPGRTKPRNCFVPHKPTAGKFPM